MKFSIAYHGDDNWTIQNEQDCFWCGEQGKWQPEERILFSSCIEELFSFDELKDFIKEKFNLDLDNLN